MKRNWFVIIIINLLLFGCAKDELKLDNAILNDQELYNAANNHFKENKFDKAIEAFSKINQEYPYSKFAVRSQVMETYSYYLKEDYDMAINLAEDFIKIYPANQYISYIYYLKALAYYDQIKDIHHDQKITEHAREAAINLISRFSDSDYARDFRIKLNLINEYLAGKEMMTARFYLGKGEILAALNRFKIVVNDYQTTIHIEEALYRLVECYIKFGIKDEAKRYAAILAHNYPKGKWYSYAYDLLNKNSNNVVKSSN